MISGEFSPFSNPQIFMSSKKEGEEEV